MPSAFVQEWLDGWVSIDPRTGFPVFKRNLTVREISSILPTNPDGLAQLHHMRVFLGMENANTILQKQTKYVERFINITKDNPLYNQQLNAMVNDVNSNRVIVANARRVTERLQTSTAFGNDPDRKGVYVNEGEKPCDPCLALNGEVATQQEFTDNNMRPGDQCLGADNCLCIIIPFN